MGVGTTQEVDSLRNDHESTTAVLESDSIPPELPLSARLQKGRLYARTEIELEAV